MPSCLAVNIHFASTSTEVTAGPTGVKTALEKNVAVRAVIECAVTCVTSS